jgi:tartrate-resistant acid phosphatase type 5
MRRIWIAVILLGTLQAGCEADSHPVATAPEQPTTTLGKPTPSQELNLLVMGDWGEGTAAQRQVATAMAKYASSLHGPDAVQDALLCGDNFYFKLTGPDDPRWQTVFEQMYDPKALDFPFYTCLGNHDYDGSNLKFELAYARQYPDSRFKLPGEWYRVDLPKQKPLVTVLMLDSNKENMSELPWNQQVDWLRKELEGPRAEWTICVAHHPLFSNGFFWGNGPLQKDWGTLFQKHKVDFYLCGHEHDEEHLEIPGWFTSFVVSGGGGAHAHPLARDNRGFSREAFGFVALTLTPEKATIRFLGTNDQPLHVFERTKAGKVTVLQTTPNTPRTNPLKAFLEMKNRKPPATTQP